MVDFKTGGNILWRQAWMLEGIPILLSVGLLGYEVYAVLTGQGSPRTFGRKEAFAVTPSFWLLASLPGLRFLAEVLTILTNNKKRALHDFIAGSVVVRTNIGKQ